MLFKLRKINILLIHLLNIIFSLFLYNFFLKCNATCGEGMKNRDVVCIKQLSGSVLMVVDENNCAMEEKPETVLPCQQEPCPPQWYMMNWSKVNTYHTNYLCNILCRNTNLASQLKLPVPSRCF